MKVSSDLFKTYLESLSMEDADSIAENANDYDIAYNIGKWGSFPYPYTKKDAVEFIEHASREYVNGSEFHFGVHLWSNDMLIGACGIRPIDYKNRRCEIGYWIGKKHWGKGYAKEAVRLMLNLAFNELQMHRVIAITFAFNGRSIKLLESLGFKLEGTLRHNTYHKEGYVDELLFSMLDSEHNSTEATIEK